VRNPATNLGGGIGSIVYQIDASDYRYYHYNHKGETGALTDGSKNIIAWYEYDAWGNVVTEWQASGVENEFRFSTKQWDAVPAGPADGGLIYFGARYLDPALGRWTQMDPAGTVDGLNVYVYTANRPLTGVDPMGMRACTSKRMRSPWIFARYVYAPVDCPGPNSYGWYVSQLTGTYWPAYYAAHGITNATGGRIEYPAAYFWSESVVTFMLESLGIEQGKTYTSTTVAYSRYEFTEQSDDSCESCCRYVYRRQYKAVSKGLAEYNFDTGEVLGAPRDAAVVHLGGMFQKGECAPVDADYSSIEDFPTADLWESNLTAEQSAWLLNLHRLSF